MNLIRFFTGILFGRQTLGGVIPEPKKLPDTDRKTLAAGSGTPSGLKQVRHILEQVIELLIEPTPAAIRQAGFLLGNAGECLWREAACQQGEHCPEHIREVESVMLRARRLIEGALRIQWTQMRRITAVTQTYVPGGKISQFYPDNPGFDVKI
ncbi:MAG TPA: hypothetical protein VN737_22205 [Bryobacteraceae bacterium]|nr:hypothetical protein [Bryobacteraceae bacterium]